MERKKIDFLQEYDKEVSNGNGDWKTWSRFVLKELGRLANCSESTDEKLDSLNLLVAKEIATLKIRVGLISAGITLGLSFAIQVIIYILTKGKY